MTKQLDDLRKTTYNELSKSLIRKLGYSISVEGEHYILIDPSNEPIGMFKDRDEMLECAINDYLDN